MQFTPCPATRTIIKRNQPVVVKAIDTHSDYLNLLQNNHLDSTVNVLKRPKQRTNAANYGTIRQATIRQYFDNFAVHDADPHHDWIILHELSSDPNLRQQILTEEFISQFPQSTSYRLWVTPQHSFTGAHFDACETFNLQLYGRKKFLLYPPGIRRYNARSPLSKFGHTSEFNDFEDAGQSKTWRKNNEQRLEFILEPGDMIYIPPGWWHQVYNTTSIGINVLINFSAGKKLLKQPYILFDLMIKKILEKTNAN